MNVGLGGIGGGDLTFKEDGVNVSLRLFVFPELFLIDSAFRKHWRAKAKKSVVGEVVEMLALRKKSPVKYILRHCSLLSKRVSITYIHQQILLAVVLRISTEVPLHTNDTLATFTVNL
jgi:hypothetical protein